MERKLLDYVSMKYGDVPYVLIKHDKTLRLGAECRSAICGFTYKK
jgi:succinate dehydrogenase/fumarate reductase-like Fe-S protein